MSERDAEIREEIAAHLALAIADRMARGASREEAERAARAEFGNVTHVAEVTREAQRGPGIWLERLGQDLRYGWRALRRTPAFTAVAVATLALAIGANSAVFTVVNGVLLAPLPFRDPGRLYAASYLPTNLPFELPPGLDDRLYLEYRGHVSRFEQVAGYQRQALTLSGAGDATRLAGARASASFFAVLGVQPALGRAFTPQEDQAGNDQVVILSDRLWRTRFNGDRSILGATITLDGIPRTVVGVMPRGLTFPPRPRYGRRWRCGSMPATPSSFRSSGGCAPMRRRSRRGTSSNRSLTRRTPIGPWTGPGWWRRSSRSRTR